MMEKLTLNVALLVLISLLQFLSCFQLTNQQTPFTLKALAPQGIVVPKRSALISGLNSQFKVKPSNKTSPGFLAPVNLQQTNNLAPNNNQVIQPTVLSTTNLLDEPAKVGIFRPPFSWLGARVNNQKKNLNQQQQIQLQNGLYLDKHQQEILAANPNLLNPPQAGSQISSNLLSTRSESSLSSAPINDPMFNQNVSQQNRQQQYADGHQLYRGFSLIELEVKSDSDRRYVQDLYANLTAAINEQAQNPNIVAVSPYVDVDFWSFKYALNDQIDIMVSPKSRAFILGQLNRAKIRHRIKIDDIQSRLDQQQQQLQPSGASQVSESGSINARELPQPNISSKHSSANNNHLIGRQSATNFEDISGLLNGRQAGANETNRKPMNESIFFDNYQRLADINQYLEYVLERNRDIAQVKVIGRSSQGRYLRVLKLGYDQTDLDGTTSTFHQTDSTIGGSSRTRQAAGAQNNASTILDNFFRKQESVQKVGSIWLDGGTHAREWISPATVLYITFRLSDNHSRCRKFFDTLRLVVSQANAMENNMISDSARAARRYSSQSKPLSASLDVELLSGINEINSNLLGAKPKPTRARTELEHTMELLAKSPQEVASEYGCDLEIESILRRYTFFIMPVLNVDGYEYSHTHNRLWRKTRSQSNHPIYRHFCLGADPNRNYDARHGSTGSSTHPCSQTYAGTVPFTEPETRHQSNFVYANRNNMKMFISFHSYSQMILLPYSHSNQLAPDHKDLDLVGQAAVKAIERTHGTVYKVGPSAAILYTASGTASDWAYEKAGIKYSYTIELRDTGTYGFLLPKQQIIPTGEETFNGLLAMIAQMEKNERKSTSNLPLATRAQQVNHSASVLDVEEQPMDMNHVPNLENLNSQTRHKNQRPNLENVLVDSNSKRGSGYDPLNPQVGPVNGVRDRRPASEIIGNDDLRLATTTTDPNNSIYHHSYTGSSPYEPEPFQIGSNQAGNRILNNEDNFHEDHESDSGYAFEGEGELMEPTRDNILEAERMSAQMRLAGRQDHSRRIVQSAGLTSTGRNLINSPLLSSRQSSQPISSGPIKRESSEDLILSKNDGLHV